jgi:hypothetical protein
MLIQLNDRWRVIDSDDRPPYGQWMLQRLDSGDWKPKSFCQTRKALLVAINEKIVRADKFYAGAKAMAVDPLALDAVKNLPERFPQRDSPTVGYTGTT